MQRARSNNLRLPVFVLRCVVWRAPSGAYYAECIDLDIAVSAQTADAATRNLFEAMDGYLKVALDGGSVDGLAPRRSPLSHRLRYHWYCLKAALCAGRRDFRLVDRSPNFSSEPLELGL